MRIAGAAAALLVCQALLAQEVSYRVEVEAPRDIAAILRKGLSLQRWQNDPQMTAERVHRLVEEAEGAREVAATEGYFSPQVEVRIDEAQTPWRISLTVEAGERTRVAEVELRFTGPAAQDAEAQALFKRVRDHWRLRRGEPFRQAEWDAAKREAAAELASWRYAAARVADSRATIDPDKREARLEVELASGPAFRFGEVRVTGLKRYADAVAENLSPVRAGATYDRDLVLAYQRRLLETGYFASVQADIDTHPLLADAAPLRVAVIEASTQHVEAGVGYSTDGGPRAELRYSNQDVFDSAWRFRSALRADQILQQLQLDLDAPPSPARAGTACSHAPARPTSRTKPRASWLPACRNRYVGISPIAFIVSAHLEEQRVGGDPTDNRHACTSATGAPSGAPMTCFCRAPGISPAPSSADRRRASPRRNSCASWRASRSSCP